MKYIYTLLFCFLAICWSCTKDDNNFIFEGHVYYGNSGMPFPNATVTLTLFSNESIDVFEKDTISTDLNGYFKFEKNAFQNKYYNLNYESDGYVSFENKEIIKNIIYRESNIWNGYLFIPEYLKITVRDTSLRYFEVDLFLFDDEYPLYDTSSNYKPDKVFRFQHQPTEETVVLSYKEDQILFPLFFLKENLKPVKRIIKPGIDLISLDTVEITYEF